MNQAKFAVPSHSGPLWWEKIGKVANWAKLAVLSHSEPLQWEKIGKVVNRAKFVILSHFGGKRLEKLQIWQNWPFQLILSHFGGKGWKSSELSKIQLFFGGRGTSVNSNLTLDKKFFSDSQGGLHQLTQI